MARTFSSAKAEDGVEVAGGEAEPMVEEELGKGENSKGGAIEDVVGAVATIVVEEAVEAVKEGEV